MRYKTQFKNGNILLLDISDDICISNQNLTKICVHSSVNFNQIDGLLNDREHSLSRSPPRLKSRPTRSSSEVVPRSKKGKEKRWKTVQSKWYFMKQHHQRPAMDHYWPRYNEGLSVGRSISLSRRIFWFVFQDSKYDQSREDLVGTPGTIPSTINRGRT